MGVLTLELPAMYADHHVMEVRRLLLELPGIKELYASSSFQVVQVDFDESQVEEAQIRQRLDEAGYFGDLTLPAELDQPAAQHNGSKAFFRHTAVAVQAGKKDVGFTQEVPYSGRPVWPCPGIGVLPLQEEELSHG